MPQTMAMAVEPAAMMTELTMYLAMGALTQMSAKLDHRALMGKNLPSMAKISLRLFRAVVNITK